MLKTISAALLAVSVLAAPAMAAAPAKATQTKTAQAPVIKAEPVKQAKSSALNANARMGRHHVKHVRHHRSHKHVGALKTHRFSKAAIKHVAPVTKRG